MDKSDSADSSVKKLVKEVASLKKSGQFPKYIDEIYFPYYKNFKKFDGITFDYPLTVFVGKNGSGKSSILHALYGCPHGKSTGHFWFSTATDPIQEGDGKGMVQSFVYSFTDNGEHKQTVLRRSPRPGTKTKRKDPDYWETDKPVKKYKMWVKNRCAPIDWGSMYVDFRQELSAFDKFFYFGDISGLKSTTKQDFVRRVSPELKRALVDKNKKFVRGRSKTVQNDEFIKLGEKELHFISEILGVKYVSGKMIRHHFYKNWGISAMVRKNDFSYTEAHAGSGEFAVISLVHRLSTLERDDSKLILLDEPETSLYPGAQKRLLAYLLQVIKETKSQIMIATHSENFISNLPNEAIKAVHYNEDTQNAEIQNGCSPSTVFSELEIPIKNKCTICVEDEAACVVLQSVLDKTPLENKIRVRHLSLGADSLKKQAILSSSQRLVADDYYVLDGDQRFEGLVDIDELPSNDLNNLTYIDRLVDSICKKIPFPSSKGRNERRSDIDPIRLDAEQNYLRFFYNNVRFLPKANPEDIIWNKVYLEKLIKCDDLDVTLNESQKKNTLIKIASLSMGTRANHDEYYGFYKKLAHYWAVHSKESEEYRTIYTILSDFNDDFEKKNYR